MARNKGSHGHKTSELRNIRISLAISESELRWLDTLCKLRKEANLRLCTRSDVLLYALKNAPGILIPPAPPEPKQASGDPRHVEEIYDTKDFFFTPTK